MGIKTIDELWIFSKDGVPLVEVMNEVEFQPALMGGLLSAMRLLSQEVAGGLRDFTLGDRKFVISSCLNDNVFLVSCSKIKIKDKKIHKLLSSIIKVFERIYTPADITTWDGDVDSFEEFQEKVNYFFKKA